MLVDMSLFAKPTITCNMEFSLFPFDVQRCQVKIQVRNLGGKNLFLILMMFQASQSRDRLDLKILPGLNYSHGFEISTEFEDLGGGDMAPIFQNAHLDYEIEVHHLPEEVRQVIFFFNN